MRNQLSVKNILFLSGFLLLIGGGGLSIILLYLLPTLGPRWLLYFFLFLVLVGISLPVIYIFHRRFSKTPLLEFGPIIRQAVWVGVYGGLLLWLQLGRVLDANRALFIAIGFVVIESLLRFLEKTRWHPKDVRDE